MTLADRLDAALRRAAGARVLVAGDLMLDRYAYGSVRRISPEGPVPVFLQREIKDRLGGAGNVCNNLVALGLAPVLVAAVGDDAEGAALRTLVGGLCEADLELAGTVPTTVKTRLIAAAQQVLRFDREGSGRLPGAVGARLVERFRLRVREADLVILSDYDKGVLRGGVAERMIDAAVEAGVAVMVDPKSRDFGRYRGAHSVTPNLSELSAAAGHSLSALDEVAGAARELCARHRIGEIAVTLSERGILIVDGDDEVARPAHETNLFDVTGAGDTVMAALALARLGGLGRADAAEVAMAAAGVAVTRPGAVSVAGAEIVLVLSGAVERGAAKVVRDWDVLSDRVARWRAAGQTVGFANGVFDLVHPGHLSLLEQASAQCDRLIVAVNGDESVRRLKGPSRPIQSETARARVIAAMEGVAAVTVFDQDTPLELITALVPDLLVKGSDYAADQIVGGDVVRAAGGTVLLVDVVGGFSTSNSVAKMRRGGRPG